MPDYALQLSEAEIARYQLMAETAERAERDLWIAAGAAPGARIADVGCGPGAISGSPRGSAGPTMPAPGR
jgi:2-polyprenyl-3-methyl-5-hydroxy-6-metoxy-1,4-benzoquinol methylase